ncbi:putative transcription factor MYB-HB-like family [Helianthus annuus]|uniref:Putative homeodomain-like protein n=1 Tax=Helianthus annuus TaxID=4232 RepID=A0A251UP98_HELAN|nr:transcription factor MYB36 [Helianthus annuus]KAF5817573.1 putative transcription factor MYB-related family [Helianthus annuus]KAJ0939001.1 putative transcription factor MYB-HB-like family [Helianthus annuus]KAJ0950918.1 putative transcription factor MYB-HB-like family [Helianthus annuus]
MDGPNIRHGEFSEEEDKIICSLYASIGSRWSLIAAQLPGRTDNDIENYWNTKLKKKILTYFQEKTSFFPSIPFQQRPPSNDHLTSHQFLNILSDTSYNNEHVPPSLGLMAMARLPLSDTLNDISYNNEQANYVGSVAYQQQREDVDHLREDVGWLKHVMGWVAEELQERRQRDGLLPRPYIPPAAWHQNYQQQQQQHQHQQDDPSP